jgi:hypothetical protein
VWPTGVFVATAFLDYRENYKGQITLFAFEVYASLCDELVTFRLGAEEFLRERGIAGSASKRRKTIRRNGLVQRIVPAFLQPSNAPFVQLV